MVKRVAWVVAAVLALALGCDGNEPTEDAGPGTDAGTDAGPPLSCSFPDAVIGGTPATDAVADAPARCGQAAHTWLRDPQLGTVTEIGSSTRYPTAVVRGLIASAEVTLPREPTDDVESKEYRYLTQDRGAIVETTATMVYPVSRTPGSALDIVLFLHGTSGFKEGCGPSEDETGLIAALLASFGYIVVMPDFLGLEWGDASYGELHPYLTGQPTAIASLDAVRAAATLAPAERGNVCALPRLITFGASQGGHAALWVDRLLPYYAREIEHLGVIAAVPPSDLLGQTELALSSLISASSNIAAMYATMPFWYGFEDRLDEMFPSPLGAEVVAALRVDCTPDSFDGLTMISDVYTTAMTEAATMNALRSVDPWGCMAAENGLTTTSIPRLGGEPASFGILFITGENDALVSTSVERNAYRTLCEDGQPLQYLECAGAEHTDAVFWPFPEILGFIDARSAGEAFTPAACTPSAPVTCSGTPAP